MPRSRIQNSPVPWWKWSSSTAALTITLVGGWYASRPPKPPAIVSIDVKVTGVVQKTVPLTKAEVRKTFTRNRKTTSSPATW